MHAAPLLDKPPLISSYCCKKYLAKINVVHKMVYNFLTADEWRMYPFNIPLSAPAYCWVHI